MRIVIAWPLNSQVNPYNWKIVYKMKKLLLAAAFSVAALSGCSSSDDDDNDTAPVAMTGVLSEGVSITMRNTLEEGGPEGPFPGLFGLADDAYDEVGAVSFTESEFPTALAQAGTPVGDIPGLYDIDFTADSISFTALPAADDPFWSNNFAVFPAGKFDRYYFTFAAPHGITSGTSANSSVALRIDSPTVAVVELSENYDFNAGIAFTIDLQ